MRHVIISLLLDDSSSELLLIWCELSDSSLVGMGESLSPSVETDNDDDDLCPDARPDSESDEFSLSFSSSEWDDKPCDSSVYLTVLFK